MTRWHKWRALSWADRRLLLRAVLLLLQARARAQSTRFQPEATDDPAAGQAIGPDPSRVPRAQQVARLVSMASSGAPGAFTCLHRSLVTWRLLRQEGIPCRLRLGAAEPGEGPFEAHAWVECDGIPLGEQDAHLARYSPFGRAVIPVGWQT